MDIAKAFEDKNIPTIKIQAENVETDIRTFLWVNLQLDSICEISKAQKDRLVEDALKSLPQALNCFAWIIYAQRLLTTREIQITLATRSSYNSGKGLELDPPKVILEACGNLLEKGHGVIRPIHYTVQEFLGKHDRKVQEDSIQGQMSNSNIMNTRLGQVCLENIRLAAFNKPAAGPGNLWDRLEQNRFSGYAIQNFDYHFSKCNNISSDTIELLKKLLQQDSKSLATILQIKMLQYGLDFDSFQNISILGSSPCPLDTPPVYALHLTSFAGLVTTVGRLLDVGCDVNERGRSGTTPLYLACYENHREIVQKLLKKGVDVNDRGGVYGNALQATSAAGNEQVAKLLLEKDADINAQGG
ncbi:ankyrin [Delitschia confertaspora ATCC 74209]|uniref:Ankyrin n=1 Tax=Delitschia confertaspora ATCC 74209 TaxID=1513339 RepID=A0A9P4JGL6_9PLEO|nr:ankyrin [Delitschia confertaspora ATCC 74209]